MSMNIRTGVYGDFLYSRLPEQWVEGQGNKLCSDSEPRCGQQRTKSFAKAPFSSRDRNSPIGAREFYRFGYLNVSEIWLVSGEKLQVFRAEIQEGETRQCLQCKLHAKSFLGRKLCSDSQGFRAGTGLEKCRREVGLGRALPGETRWILSDIKIKSMHIIWFGLQSSKLNSTLVWLPLVMRLKVST